MNFMRTYQSELSNNNNTNNNNRSNADQQRQRKRRPLALTFDHQGNTTAPLKPQVWSSQRPVQKQQPFAQSSRKGRHEELEGQHPDFFIPEQGEEGHEEMMHKIAQRNKQLALGKITQGYKNYVACVRNEEREADNEMHVVTPRATWDISKRKFDGYLRQWRRDLHGWDTEVHDTSNVSESSEGVSGEATSMMSSEPVASTHETSFVSHAESCYSDLPPLVAMDEAIPELPEIYELQTELNAIPTPNLTPIATYTPAPPIPADFTEKDIEPLCVALCAYC